MTSTSSCIKNLPNELLAKIFSTVENGCQDSRELPSPALLSSVCRHWRMLAQNTPELWVNIIVPLRKSPEDCIRWTADWIARSGVLLISVMIGNTTGNRTWIGVHFTNLMGLLSKHSERIRRLMICGISSALFEWAFSKLQSAPNLQQLTICSDNISSSGIQVVPSQRQYWLNFPKLTVLKVQGLIVPSISNLTSLTIRKLSGSYYGISQIFTTSPGLKHLTLPHLLPLAIPPQTTLIRADSLHSLAISLVHSHPPGQASYIFNYLAMPNIKYLELDGDAWRTSDLGQSLSSAHLDTLRISNRSENSLDIDTINFFRSFSTLRHLQLVHASTRGLLSKGAQRLVRKTSMNFRNLRPNDGRPYLYAIQPIQPVQPAPANVWPELRIITLDTLTAGDVVNLCDFLTCHKHVQVVELSTSARRHLSSSLRRNDDTVYQRPSLFKAAGSEEGLNDVEEWLGKMVDIRVLRSPSVGLLYAD